MKQRILKVHTADNVIVALQNLQTGETIPITREKMVCTPGNDVEATTGQAAGGEVIPKAVLLNQDDFIPW